MFIFQTTGIIDCIININKSYLRRLRCIRPGLTAARIARRWRFRLLRFGRTRGALLLPLRDELLHFFAERQLGGARLLARADGGRLPVLGGQVLLHRLLLLDE